MGEIIFIRHGEARKRNKTPKGDVMLFVHDEMSRELTTEGRENVPYLGNFDMVISSPATRAIQTAMIASRRNPNKIINSLSTHLWPAESDDNDWELVENIFVYLRGGKDKKNIVGLKEAYQKATSEELRACKRISRESAQEISAVTNQKNHRILVAGHMLHLQGTAVEMFGDEVIDQKTGLRVKNLILAKADYMVINF